MSGTRIVDKIDSISDFEESVKDRLYILAGEKLSEDKERVASEILSSDNEE